LAINFAVQENPKGVSMLLLVLGSVGLTCGLQLLFQVLGPFGVLLNPLLAFPVAYVCMRAGVTPALLALLLVVAVVRLQTSTIHALFYLLQFGAASLVLPVLLRRGTDWFRAVTVCLVLTVSVIGIAAVGFTVKNQTTIDSIVDSYVDGEVAKAKVVYEQADLPADQVRELLAVLDSTALFFKQSYVGLS